MTDETIIRRVTDRIQSQYDGPDRRQPTPDYIRWLPLGIVAISAAVGYGSLQTRVEGLSDAVSELKVEVRQNEAEGREAHAALWRRVTE